MVASRAWLVVALALFAGALSAQDAGSDAGDGPVLYGDGGGRVWKWTAGEKTWLTPEGMNLTLGGVGDDQLWGWAHEGPQARLFVLPLPKKEEAKKDEAKAAPPAAPLLESLAFPVPDRADRLGDRVLLAWGTKTGFPRFELWQAGEQLAAKAWDDGRSLYALAVGPQGWILAGRTADGHPWLEVSGMDVAPPEGWRGRLTVAAWVPEKEDKKEDKKEAKKESKAKAPPVVHPWAAGWGAPLAEAPRALFWAPDGWTQPDPAVDPLPGSTYPLLGAAGDSGTLVLAGWQADAGTGALRPWFWDGEAAEVPGGTADGQPVAFSAGGKGGAFLVVHHESAPWFTLEDGKESLPLEGFNADDRVVAVESTKASP